MVAFTRGRKRRPARDQKGKRSDEKGQWGSEEILIDESDEKSAASQAALSLSRFISTQRAEEHQEPAE